MFISHTSGTPPTRVLTVNNPQLAASNMAIQKASVKELQQVIYLHKRRVQQKRTSPKPLKQPCLTIEVYTFTYALDVKITMKYKVAPYPSTCSRIYGQRLVQTVLEHEAQHPTFQPDLEENAFPSSLPTVHV